MIFREDFRRRGKELILRMDRLSQDGLNINSIKNKQMKEARESFNEKKELLIFKKILNIF